MDGRKIDTSGWSHRPQKKKNWKENFENQERTGPESRRKKIAKLRGKMQRRGGLRTVGRGVNKKEGAGIVDAKRTKGTMSASNPGACRENGNKSRRAG